MQFRRKKHRLWLKGRDALRRCTGHAVEPQSPWRLLLCSGADQQEPALGQRHQRKRLVQWACVFLRAPCFFLGPPILTHSDVILVVWNLMALWFATKVGRKTSHLTKGVWFAISPTKAPSLLWRTLILAWGLPLCLSNSVFENQALQRYLVGQRLDHAQRFSPMLKRIGIDSPIRIVGFSSK